LLGADTDAILADTLGLSVAEIAALHASGVLGTG
jgi:crotonobetainyl-CoA:carnitine CoA-transferase CaiB-like acyl-CoA transferase